MDTNKKENITYVDAKQKHTGTKKEKTQVANKISLPPLIQLLDSKMKPFGLFSELKIGFGLFYKSV